MWLWAVTHDRHMRWLKDALAHRALFYDPEWLMAFRDHSNHLGLFATGALPPSILPRQSSRRVNRNPGDFEPFDKILGQAGAGTPPHVKGGRGSFRPSVVYEAGDR